MHTFRPLWWPTLAHILVALHLLAPAAIAAPGDVNSSCTIIVPRIDVQHLYNDLLEITAGKDCTFEGTQTNKALTIARWSPPGKAPVALNIASTECMEQPPYTLSGLGLAPTQALMEQCPKVWHAVSKTLAQKPEYAVQSVGISLGEPAPMPWVANLIASLTLIALIVLLAQRWRTPFQWDRSFVLMAASVFGLALLARVLVPYNLANWYTEVLPPIGDASNRFGPGVFIFQAALRSLLPWTDQTWMVVNVLMGALVAPVLLVIANELSFSRLASLVTAVLTALSPYLVRVSASPSEQVLATLLCLCTLALWLRGLRKKAPWTCVTAFLLGLCASLVRADMMTAICAITAWGFIQHTSRWTLRASVVWTIGFTIFGLWAIQNIVIPSNHPTPTSDMIWEVVYHANWLTQFATVAWEPPHWLSPINVGLVLCGVFALRKQWRILLGILLFLTLIFVPLGRLMGRDEMLSGRYFLAAISVFLLPVGVGVEWLAQGLTRIKVSKHRAIALLTIVAVLTSGAICIKTYEIRYTFQDEYDFLDSSLSELPEGCTVYQVPVRHVDFEKDMDCCLWARQSPIVLAYPHLSFREINPHALPKIAKDQCAAYYEGAICSVEETEAAMHELPTATAKSKKTCEAVRSHKTLTLLSEGQATPNVPNPIFTKDIPIRLYRWTP